MLFLSYARNDDEPFVRKLHKDLTRHEFEVWWDRAAMESRGRTFLQEIRDAIEGSDRVLVVIGPAALSSDYVRVEWEHAPLFCKGVLSLLRQGEFLSSNTPDALRREISALHTVDFRPSRPYDEALTELLRLLHETVPPLAPFRTVVPALPPHFLPRRVDLDGLGALVLADVQRPVVITSAKQTTALQGMGGIGKSVLAAAFVRTAQARRTFQDGIVWLRAGPRANPLECVRQAGYALGGAPEHYVSMEIAQVHIPGLLAEKVCLLVLDDVWDVMQAAPLRSALGPRCRLLITTRDGSLVSSLGAQERRVDVLSEDAALALLADWSDQKTRELSEAHQVAQECGFLPFALALCGALARDGVPWADIRDALRAADLAFIKRQFPDYPYPDMLKAFQVSLEALERSSVCAAECYRELAVFSADTTVPEAAVVTLWLHKRPMKDREGRELLATLERKAMLNLSGQAPGRRVSLHDLQRDYLDGLALGRSDALHQRLLAAYAARCANGWSTGPNDGYFFHRLAFHLVQGGRKMELHQLLLNFDWLQARLDATDGAGLIADYNYLLGNADLRVIQGALGLSAHVIAQDKTQLAGQLLGRLLPTAAMENQGLWQKMKDWLRRKQLAEQTQIPCLLDGIVQWKGSPWLRPLRGILSPPGGALLRTLTGHTDQVTVVAVTADGQRAVSGSADCSLKLWDLEVGQELRTLTGHTGEVTAVAVTADGSRAVSGSADRSLKLWDLEVGQELRTFTGHTDKVTAVAVTADGHWALSGSMDRTLKLWDLAAGQELRTLSGHKDWVASIAISTDGQRVLSGSWCGGVRVWDLASGQQLQSFTNADLIVVTLAETSNGWRAVCTSEYQDFRVWDFFSGKSKGFWGHQSSVTAVALTTDGSRAVSASGDWSLKLWDLESGQELRTLGEHSNGATAVALTADARRAVSASADRTVKLWDLQSGQGQPSFAGHSNRVTAVTVAASGQRAISVADDGILKMWDMVSGKELSSLHAYGHEIAALAVTPDGRQAVTVCERDDVLAGDSNAIPQVWDLDRGEARRTLEGHRSPITKLEVTPDGSGVVSIARDGTIMVWDLATGAAPRTFKSRRDSVSGLAVFADRLKAVLGLEDHTLRLWDLESGQELRTLTGHTDEVAAVAVSADGRWAVSGSWDRSVKVWDLEIGQEVRTFAGHTKPVTGVAVSASGWCATSVSLDQTVKAWDLSCGKVIASFAAENPLLCCAVTPDGRTIVAGDTSGRIYFLRLEGMGNQLPS